ncbi:Ran GTPase activator [Glomus cerebriforme]|uniref:Ran GTPase activator n=1 Tax=Glomus cerebriforme TaxID=658196 RepID=A0A397T5Z7_9GLOM|nr:Ran GTPase activator [Glomus cerebriforme]
MSVNASANVFSIEGKGLKLDTAEDVQDFVNSILEIENLEQVILSGNTFGVEAAQAIAGALKGKDTIRIVNASDIFTSRLREEIPHAVKAICDALEDKEKLNELNFSDNAFGPAGAEPMVDFLNNNRSLQVLKLNNNGLGVRGGTIIGKALLAAANKNVSEGRTSSLRTIIAGRNRLENGSSRALADAIAGHGTLTEIRMPQNGIRPEGIVTLSKGFGACKNLEILDLQDNTFTVTGSVAFAKALVEWPNLKVLNIGDCLLSEKGGVAIAEALLLGHNKKLETLNLQYNEIDSKGVKILATAISTHLKNLSSLELNGNKVNPEDISIQNARSALEDNGHADALGELDDMEISDEEEDELDEEDTEENEAKLDEEDTTEPVMSKKVTEKVTTEELDVENQKESTLSKKFEKLSVKELENKEDLVEPQLEAQKSEKRSIEAKAAEDKSQEINREDQENQLVNSGDQVESLTERITKVQVLS